MEWRDEGLVIGVRRHGETSAIVELMTRDRGRHLGVVRGGRSRTMRPILQPGNSVAASWRARLDEHMGAFAIEGTVLRAADVMASAFALDGINWIAALLRLLPERDPHRSLYEAANMIADRLGDHAVTRALMVRFELEVLTDLGFGLDLDACAATGTSDDLVYVSPKSGRAVSRLSGAPYRERLLALPAFLRGGRDGRVPSDSEVMAGFRLTGHFLQRDVFEPRGLPIADARRAFIDRACPAAAGIGAPRSGLR